ncbi:hypothetical protein D3C86_1818920 [compost metagenome]
MPVILNLQDPDLKPMILTELDRIHKLDGQTDVSRFLEIIRGSAGIKEADRLSQVYIDKAISALDMLPDIQAKKDLIEIAHFIGNRSY